MSKRSFEDFEREEGLPAIATKQQLKDLGARYMAGEPFTHPTTQELRVIEACFLERGGRQYSWKRIGKNYATPTDTFEIHKSYLEMEVFILTKVDLVEYVKQP